MDDAGRLLECFGSGRLVRPSAGSANFVDLVRALLRLCGAVDVESGPGVERICRLIGSAEHYVLVLVDGLGVKLLEELPADGFLRSHLAAELQAVFPPTTASALTTLATGKWPCEHGVPGWWVYLERFKLSATALRFVERFSERPLEEFGVSAADVFPAPSIWPGVKHEPLTVAGANIVNSTFSRYARGGTAGAGYAEVPEALQIVRDRVGAGGRPSITYVYLPQLDAICHRHGTDDEGVGPLLAGLDEQLGDLANDLAGRARLVIAADHGLVNTPPERTFILEEDDPLMTDLICPPTGEPTVPICHVKPGRQEHFYDGFARRFGGAFLLITPDEAERLRLFGPGPLSPVTRRRLGSFLGIAPEPAAVYFRPRTGAFHVHVGVHAGLSPEEMIIPLILS